MDAKIGVHIRSASSIRSTDKHLWGEGGASRKPLQLSAGLNLNRIKPRCQDERVYGCDAVFGCRREQYSSRSEILWANGTGRHLGYNTDASGSG